MPSEDSALLTLSLKRAFLGLGRASENFLTILTETKQVNLANKLITSLLATDDLALKTKLQERLLQSLAAYL